MQRQRRWRDTHHCRLGFEVGPTTRVLFPKHKEKDMFALWRIKIGPAGLVSPWQQGAAGDSCAAAKPPHRWSLSFREERGCARSGDCRRPHAWAHVAIRACPLRRGAVRLPCRDHSLTSLVLRISRSLLRLCVYIVFALLSYV